MDMNWQDVIKSLEACKKPEWYDAHAHLSAAEMWAQYGDGSDMAWLVVRLNIDRKRLVLALCDCADLVSSLRLDDIRIGNALSLARSWADGSGSYTLVRYASAVVDKVCDDAYDRATTVATMSTYYATMAACHAVGTAIDHGADLAFCVPYSVARAVKCAGAGTEDSAQARCAGVIRKHFPECPKF